MSGEGDVTGAGAGDGAAAIADSGAPGARDGAAPGTRDGGAPGARDGGAPGARDGGMPGARDGEAPGARDGGATASDGAARTGVAVGPDRRAAAYGAADPDVAGSGIVAAASGSAFGVWGSGCTSASRRGGLNSLAPGTRCGSWPPG